jgi:uncharacterized protein (TIGR03067 family)
MKNHILALGPPLGLAAAVWAADPVAAADRERLQGRWEAFTAERSGAPAPDLVGHLLTLGPDRFWITLDGRLLYGGTYVADPSAQPARITFRQSEGPTLRGEWLGIYRFDGTRLEIVDNADDMSRPRPTEFATAPGSGQVLVRFEPR